MIPVNPVPSLRLVGVRAMLGDTLLRVPPLPAAAWLEALYTGGIGEILTLCEDSERLEDAIADGEVGSGQLEKTLRDMLAAAAGRDSGVTLRLLANARGSWARVCGELARGGMDLDRVPLGRFLDAVYTIFTRSLDVEALAKFDAELLGPHAPSSSGRGRPAPSPVPASAAQYVGSRSRTRTRPLQRPPDDPSPKPTPPPAAPARSAPRPTSGHPPVAVWPASGRGAPLRPTAPTPRLR